MDLGWEMIFKIFNVFGAFPNKNPASSKIYVFAKEFVVPEMSSESSYYPNFLYPFLINIMMKNRVFQLISLPAVFIKTFKNFNTRIWTYCTRVIWKQIFKVCSSNTWLVYILERQKYDILPVFQNLSPPWVYSSVKTSWNLAYFKIAPWSLKFR
jgi:hypothetical protein